MDKTTESNRPDKKKKKPITFDQSEKTHAHIVITETTPPLNVPSGNMVFEGIDFSRVEKIVFCFKPLDSYLRTSCLNRTASIVSRYIHCEICIGYAGTHKTLTINSHSKVAVFCEKGYDDDWAMIAVSLGNDMRRKRRLFDIVTQIMTRENDRTFWAWNVYCFLCFSLPFCYSGVEAQTRTCSEMTMRVLNHVWELRIAEQDCFRYTPEQVYTYICSLIDKNVLIKAEIFN